MKSQEKRYRVDSFVGIKKILDEAGAKKGKEIVTTHYYAQQDGNDVVKLVDYDNRNEIHILKESDGNFSLTEKIPVESVDVGLKWLEDKGYETVDVVKMIYTDYEYKGGLVGLYIIDDFLHSVILDFPPGQHKAIGKGFGLSNAEIISVPYNKYLKEIGRLGSMKLS